MKRSTTHPSGNKPSGSSYSGATSSQPAQKRTRFQADDFDDGGFVPDEDIADDGGVYERIEGVGEGDDGDQHEGRWIRAKTAPLDPATQPLSFHWLDIDMISGAPLPRNPAGGDIVGSTESIVPIIRLYGVTRDGHSVLANIHGVTPYFYASFSGLTDMSDATLGMIRMALDSRMRERLRGEDKQLKNCVLGVTRTRPSQSLVGFHTESKVFAQIFLAMPSMVPAAKRLVDEGFAVPNLGTLHGQTFESNVPFVLRFMIDNAISGADWVELPANTYSLRPSAGLGTAATSRCTWEVDVCYTSLVAHETVGEFSALAPLRVLSFDIECMGRKGHFPDAQFDPVIQVAAVLALQGSDVPLTRHIFTLDTCLPIVGAVVDSSSTEAQMLLKFRAFVLAADPDILTGYNIANFDIPYLLNRAKVLEKQGCGELRVFADLGRIRGVRAVMRDTTFQSSAFGKRENVETTVTGRVIFDVLPYMQRNHKLSSYSLNSVSAEFLGQQKEDVHHSIISELQQGSEADRRRLAVYCLKDALLPLLLLRKLSVVVNYVEMARVTGVPLSFILTRGQQIKVFSMILRKCKREGLLVPHVNKSGAAGAGAEEGGYEGATVIEPVKAFYEVPIATLDFASLYPSIMQAHNLCYSTLLSEREAAAQLAPDQFEKSPTAGAAHVFVKASAKKGILPQILDELLAARKRAKKDMNAATDPMEKAVQNGRQLALKISANSVYGFTGATVGQLPCLPIASAVTAYGRNLLLATKAHVEATYARARVIYGDTDSVMVDFGVQSVEQAMPLAQQAAQEISRIFPRPITLEFEKVYFPYLLMNKKRYAGLLWTQPDKYDKLDAKGLETVRRDNCLLVRQVVSTCLHKILVERDVAGAVQYTKHTIAELLQNKLDISMLVITKSLGKSADDSDYSAKQAHVELAMRMRKRDPGSAPAVGDRVPYVILQAAKGTPAYEKSEDPVYVLDHALPIDTEYYLHNQLSGPLQRIFEPIIPNPQSLIAGDHTRAVCKPTPKAGGIMSFAVKKETCLGCRTVLPAAAAAAVSAGGVPLCTNCRGRESEIYIGKLEEVNAQQRVYNALWTECQRCQGSFHQEVLCSNRDCPIFYKRKKVQMDLQSSQAVLDRFAW